MTGILSDVAKIFENTDNKGIPMGILHRIEYLLKHNSILYEGYKFLGSLSLRCAGVFLKTENDMVLFTAQRKRYNDSPRAIYQEMVKKGMDRSYHCVWAVDDPQKYDIPGNADVIVMDTWQYFKTALKAKYWVCSVNIERGLHFKKKKTVFLNTWHCIPTNYMGNAVDGRKDFDWRKTDYICCSGEYEVPIIIRDCVAYEKNILRSGLPRNDILYHYTEEMKQELRHRLGIGDQKKVLLYAPTWRDSTDFGINYELKPPIDWEQWRRELEDDYVVLMRTHPYTNKLCGIEFDDFILDCSEYPDVNELLIIADVLISDYSSIMFDYSILEKPMICFGYDYDEYVKHRGFYFDLDQDLPNGIIRSDREVLDLIQSMDYKEQCGKTRELKDKYIMYGGNATDICLKALFSQKTGN